MSFRDRVKELRRVKASELIPNEKNWRIHSQYQSDILQGILTEVGYAGAVLAYETPEGLKLIDGHLRVETTPDQEIPVLVLDVNDSEADKLLAVYDPISERASKDGEKLKELLGEIDFDSDALQSLTDELLTEAKALEESVMPEYDEAITEEVEYIKCPQCNHEWPK